MSSILFPIILQVMQVQDQKANNTAGDTFTAGAYQASALQTVVGNSITGASLAANQVTLPAGTFEVDARIAASAGLQRAAIYDATNTVYLIKGMNNPKASGSAPAGPYAFVRGVITLAAQTAIELHLRVTTTGAAEACNYGEPEVYADMIIRKIG